MKVIAKGTMAVWFTSDYHLGHANIIQYCRRPFGTVAEMDATILQNVNAVVRPEDTLYFLGDFCMGVGRDRFLEIATAYRRQIHCHNIHMIWGNHDRRDLQEFAALFSSTHDLLEVRLQGWILTLCHYAMRVWNHSHHANSGQLYGHDHGRLPELPGLLAFDVGVDCWGFYPLSFEQVIEIFNYKRAGGQARDWTIIGGRLVRSKEAGRLG
jgi:calcineurin-like phosphoesterase family protein